MNKQGPRKHKTPDYLIAKIRKAYSEGDLTIDELAKELGVVPHVIYTCCSDLGPPNYKKVWVTDADARTLRIRGTKWTS